MPRFVEAFFLLQQSWTLSVLSVERRIIIPSTCPFWVAPHPSPYRASAYRQRVPGAAFWNDTEHAMMEIPMGKYVLAWILGVPAVVLVLLYLFFH